MTSKPLSGLRAVPGLPAPIEAKYVFLLWGFNFKSNQGCNAFSTWRPQSWHKRSRLLGVPALGEKQGQRHLLGLCGPAHSFGCQGRCLDGQQGLYWTL
eukprot:1449866-Amphidinium_carterae.1